MHSSSLSQKRSSEQTKMLTLEEGKKLLRLARESIQSYFLKQDINIEIYSMFNNKQGVFVTLNKNGKLRGCVGYPHPTLQLYKAVFEAARAAAFEDPRFQKLEESNLKDINIEISVLTIPEEIKEESEQFSKHIKIGDDGLIIKSSFGSGLLLPQVFTEYNCTPEQALEMTCQKAGLPTDAWKDKKNKVFKFQAQIFKEHS